MFKNVADQIVNVQLLLRADGTDATGLTVGVAVQKDGGAWVAGGGAIVEGQAGSYTYTITQAESNCDHLAIQFAEATAITQLVNIYPIDPTMYQADVSAIPSRDDADTYRTLRDGAGAVVQQIREQLHSSEQ